LEKDFALCEQLNSSDDLVNWISSGLQYMAMADYPYPANFLAPMPANPVEVFCSNLQTAVSAGSTLSRALSVAIAVYYNYTGEAGSCYNFSYVGNSNLGANGWDYQACTEMIMPISSNGTSDMFPLSIFSLAAQVQYCQQTYQAFPRPLWVPTYFGANATQISSGSNIFFSNGQLDPWRGGGVQQNISDSLIGFVIEGGAHHLDLRTPNPADPPGVVLARELETQYIEAWIRQAQ